TIGKAWNSRELDKWLETDSNQTSLRPTLIILIVLAALNILLFIAISQGSAPRWWIALTFVPYVALSAAKILRTGGLFDQALDLSAMLGSVRDVFDYLEHYPYADKQHLRALCQPFLDVNNRPSAHLRRLTRVISAASLQHTQLLWLPV